MVTIESLKDKKDKSNTTKLMEYKVPDHEFNPNRIRNGCLIGNIMPLIFCR